VAPSQLAFPRDPDFATKAGRVLDLYEGVWEGRALGPNDYVICADEKTSNSSTPPQAPDPRAGTRPSHAC
jgi:hypothetical protein